MRIGIAQIKLHDDIEKNIENIIAHIRTGAQNSIGVLCFPESCIMSYVRILEQGLDHRKDAPAIQRAVTTIHEAASAHNMDLIIGTPYFDNTTIYNAALVLRVNGSQLRYYKNNLTSHEAHVFKAGTEPLVFDLRGIRCGILICRDQNYPALASEYKRAGVRVIFLLAAHYYPPDEAKQKVDKNRALPIARALENEAYVFKANAVGKKRGYVNLGGSIIVSPNGYVLAEADQHNEIIEHYDISQ